MRVSRWWSRVAIVAGLVGAGCAENTVSAPNTSAETVTTNTGADDVAATEVREHHRHHHHGGLVHFIALSLDTLGAADEAKRPQIEKLQSDLKAHLAPARDAERALLETIADGIAAGAMDAAKLDAAVAQVAIASAAVHEASVETLNQLHALLTPEERAALVDKVQAHWQVWRSVNHQAGVSGHERGSRLAELTDELTLSSAQVDKISAALKDTFANRPHFDPAQAEEHMKAFTTAFAATTFDARTITINASSEIAKHGTGHMVAFYQTITPLLTAEQRTRLAAQLRQHSTHPAPMMGE